ncbi:MAG TPA: hypothetical protein VN688_22205 [Gemmataceae bacterium]|nr:hypothetical protein [Gemmataceae bacterium]
MSSSSDRKVTVRVEVVIEGGGEAPKVTTFGPSTTPLMVGSFVKPYQIIYPKPSMTDTTVYVLGGQNYIEANGISPAMGGSYAQKVWAKAYPRPDASPDQSGLGMPPMDAVSDTPAGDGSWSFTRAKNNPVSACAADNKPGGPDNSTLIVWYQFGGSYPNVEYTPFHGYLAVSGGSGSGAGSGLLVRAAGLTVLHASFTDALASLGTVALTWNGASWVGGSSAAGGCTLSLVLIEDSCYLISNGPGTVFVVRGVPGSSGLSPCSATGVANGVCAGSFGVTITE